MTKKIYNFDVPVSGRETFSVIASSYEEALEIGLQKALKLI